MSVEKQSSSPNSALPEGTVTFLFTDIEGSTNLLKRLGDKYISLLDDHHRILREIFSRWNGREVDTEGDAFFVSFPKATDAAGAVVEAQRTLSEHSWPGGEVVRVRMGLHTGEPWTRTEGYVGMDVHRAARIAHVGYGGQVLLSETTAALLRGNLPEGVTLRDLGQHLLKDMQFPEHIRQLVISGLPDEFPPLRSLEVLEAIDESDLEPPPLPSFLAEDNWQPREVPVFVGRDSELVFMADFMDELFQDYDVDTRGNVLFVIVDAGSGKIALMDAFSRELLARYPDLLVAQGLCNAFTGSGDPYLPFRNVMGMLAGDLESRIAGKAVSQAQMINLWGSFPLAVSALAIEGADLIDVVVSGDSLRSRVKKSIPSSEQLHQKVLKAQKQGRAASGELKQSQLFDQYASVLRAVSREHPVLIVLDDLQWADSGSINLLFHLARSMAGSHVMIVGAYRPEEIALGRDGERHPLEPVLVELKREFGQIRIDLNESKGEAFVCEFLESEPNRLSNSFGQTLLEHTGGQALFTVETLRDLQERGDLIKDDDKYWVESPSLDWSKLPTRVEGVIEARIERLDGELREVLSVAAVEGEDFTAQIIARIQQIQERKLLHTLSRELEKRHQLVKEQGEDRIGSSSLNRYRFAHSLFQRYLYNDLSTGERKLLHGEIGSILEELYADRLDKVIVQLAGHFTAANNIAKASHYHAKAGDQARQSNSTQEAIAHYRTALSLAQANNQQDHAARILMKLGLTHSLAFEFVRASEIYRHAFVVWHRASSISTNKSLPKTLQPLRIPYTFPHDLDPSKSNDLESQVVLWQLFSGLVLMTREGDILPDIAKHWKVTNNGSSFEFHLREDVFWSDGNPVTAYDFEYAWRRAIDPDSSRDVSLFFYDIRGAKAFNSKKTSHWTDVGIMAEDENTLRIELDKPVGNFLQILSMTIYYPVPKHVIEEKGENWASSGSLVSNGSYLLESYEPSKQMTLVRNPNYHGKFGGNVGRIEMPIIRQLEQEDYYESGLIDIAYLDYLPSDVASSMVRQYAEDYITAPGRGTQFIGLNPDKPPLDDINVRRALAMSFDREAFAHDVVGSLRDLADGGLIPPGVWGHTPGISLPFDPARAKRLLAKTGFDRDLDFSRVTALCHQLRGHELLFLIANWHEHLGLKINSQLIEWHEYIDYFERDLPHIYRGGWIADYPDPDSFMRSLVAKNRTRWNHPHLWDLIDEARYEINRSKRISLYQEVDKILVDEAIIIPLIYNRENLLVKPWIRKYPLSGFEMRFKDIIISDN